MHGEISGEQANTAKAETTFRRRALIITVCGSLGLFVALDYLW